MFGLFFAALCTAGLYRLWRPRRFGRHGLGGGGPRRLDRLIRKLNANPAQESAIRQSAGEIQQAFGNFNPKARLGILSGALTAETFDRDRLRAEMREPETGSLSEALVNSVERLRSSLDADQRTQMAAAFTGRGRRCR